MWPDFSFPDYGLKAKLSTEWDETLGHLNYRLTLMPSDDANSEEFFDRLSVAQHGLGEAQATLNVYDKRHFVIQDSENYLNLFTTILDSSGKRQRATYQGKLFLTRDQYAAITEWNLTVSGLPPLNRSTAKASRPQKQSNGGQSSSKVGTKTLEQRDAIQTVHNAEEGDDTASGYDIAANAIDTSAGRSFAIYKQGEQTTAIAYWSAGATFHYKCDENSLCLLTQDNSSVVLHARLRR